MCSSDLHREMLRLYRTLLRLRRERPELSDPRLADLHVEAAGSWLAMRRGLVRLAVNFGGERVTVPLGGLLDEMLLAWGDVVVTGDEAVLPPETFVLISVTPGDQA